MSRNDFSRRARGSRADSLDCTHRRVRLERTFIEELRSLLRAASDPALADVDPIAIELSPDGGHARVAYVVRGSPDADEDRVRRASRLALERASGFLRVGLASGLDRRRVPMFGFTFIGVAEETAGENGGEPCLP